MAAVGAVPSPVRLKTTPPLHPSYFPHTRYFRKEQFKSAGKRNTLGMADTRRLRKANSRETIPPFLLLFNPINIYTCSKQILYAEYAFVYPLHASIVVPSCFRSPHAWPVRRPLRISPACADAPASRWLAHTTCSLLRDIHKRLVEKCPSSRQSPRCRSLCPHLHDPTLCLQEVQLSGKRRL